MIRATKSEIKNMAEQFCPEECLYNYTPAGVVKNFVVSEQGLKKIKLKVEESLNTEKLKSMTAAYIEKAKQNLK